ncbi:MAG: DNA polymerase III subunit epsilon [Endozoicomonas sp.]
MRQIILDTETTGIDPKQGHRIIEIGCVEMVDRKLTGNHYHVYINPERVVDQDAINIHGITNEFLFNKPTFKAVAQEFLEFIQGAELIIHNAAFDIGFINHEFSLLHQGFPKVETVCGIIDTLAVARKKHPGQKNNLNALCKRYFIDNSSRTLHGALLDSEILAEVYLVMTGGQTALLLASRDDDGDDVKEGGSTIKRLSPDRPKLKILYSNDAEQEHHQRKLSEIQKKSDNCIWLNDQLSD